MLRLIRSLALLSAVGLAALPAMAVDCDFKVNSGIFSIRGDGYPDTIVWGVTSISSLDGSNVLVSGFKNGVLEVYRVEVDAVDELPVGAGDGNTPFRATYRLHASEIGTYLRYAELEDADGNIVCTTPIVQTQVIP